MKRAKNVFTIKFNRYSSLLTKWEKYHKFSSMPEVKKYSYCSHQVKFTTQK